MGTLVSEGRTLDDHARVAEIMTDRGQAISAEVVAEIVDPQAVVRAQRSLGSTNPEQVLAAVAQMRCDLESDSEEIGADVKAIEDAREETLRRVREVLGESCAGARRQECLRHERRWPYPFVATG